MHAANVHAEKKFPRRIFFARDIELLKFTFAKFTRRNEVPRQEGGRFIGGHAHVFLGECFLIWTRRADEVVVRGVVHRLAWVIRRKLQFQFFQQPLLKRILQRDAVQRKVFGVPAVPGLGDQPAKIILRAAMGGENLQLPAPGDAGIRNRVELLRVGMQRKFIEDARAALACLSIRI